MGNKAGKALLGVSQSLANVGDMFTRLQHQQKMLELYEQRQKAATNRQSVASEEKKKAMLWQLIKSGPALKAAYGDEGYNNIVGRLSSLYGLDALVGGGAGGIGGPMSEADISATGAPVPDPVNVSSISLQSLLSGAQTPAQQRALAPQKPPKPPPMTTLPSGQSLPTRDYSAAKQMADLKAADIAQQRKMLEEEEKRLRAFETASGKRKGGPTPWDVIARPGREARIGELDQQQAALPTKESILQSMLQGQGGVPPPPAAPTTPQTAPSAGKVSPQQAAQLLQQQGYVKDPTTGKWVKQGSTAP